ncbi:MAG: hypothetical protein JWP91_3830 [Fibrobacteres bacterium]|nr:hypothetical protein [Fibrobacterota bacterium]
MPFNPPAVSLKSRACLALCIASLLACQKKNDPVPPANAGGPALERPPSIPTADSGEGADLSGTDSANGSVSTEPATGPEKAEFASRPVIKAYPGRAWQYRPVLSRPGPFTLRIVQAADSAMRTDRGAVTWTPSKEGAYPIDLEAVIHGSRGEASLIRLRQKFTLTVGKVLALALKPLPAQVNKGDTVLFDLGGSSFPAWAAPSLTVRFDYQGDGTWDTDALPLASNLHHRHAFDGVGRFAPKVEARYGDSETRTAEGKVAVVSAVIAVLRISPDTVEPGGMVSIDASESKADGGLAFSLDLDGDGKPEWRDSSSMKAVLKAPASGVYQASLTARNPMGQTGKATAVLRVNSRPRLDIKVKNPKENMTAAVEFKARAKDADDSLAKVRCNFTGESNAWETRSIPADSVAGPGEWWLRMKHVYGKPGKYTAAVCVASMDGREACQQAKIEIFNAPPVCQPGPDLKATLGKPLVIEGTGVDPDGRIVKWEWDLDGDGKFDLVSAENGRFQYTFSKEGVFPMQLRVTTADGVSAMGTRKVEVRKKWKG